MGALRSLTAALLLLAVALAAGAHGGGVGSLSEQSASAVADLGLTVFTAAVVVGLVLAAVALPRPRRRRRDLRVPRHVGARGGALALVLAVVTLVPLTALVIHEAQRPPAQAPAPDGASQPTSGPRETRAPVGGLAGGAIAAVLIGGAIAAAAVVIVALGSRRHERVTPSPGAPPDVRTDDVIPADPRAAVIAAYAGGERRLAGAGLGRLAAEAPRELRDRLRGEPPVDDAALERLTELYEQARFSRHQISAAMRRDAIEASEHVRRSC